MEGNSVGAPGAGYVNHKLVNNDTRGVSATSDSLSLLWPQKLIDEIAMVGKTHNFSSPLAIISFIIASILSLALGPTQLIMLVLTNSFSYVTETYFPAALKVCLIISALTAIFAMFAMFLVYREQPKRAIMSTVLAGGALVIDGIIWINILTIIPANLLTLFVLVAMAGTIILAVIAARQPITNEKSEHRLYIALIAVSVVALTELIFTGTFVITESRTAELYESELANLGERQANARLDGVAAGLSDLTFTLCGESPYEIVYLPSNVQNSGIFECTNSREVYAVSGPGASDSPVVVSGQAFFFGVIKDPLVEAHFPAESGFRFIYQDLSEAETNSEKHQTPSQLALLAPAASEEILVNTIVEPLLGYLSERSDKNDLRVSIFYNPELNSVYSTKDYILMSARDTILLTSYLPHGNNFKSYLDGKYGTYIFSTDLQLPTLAELGASPLLYSNQTRSALNDHRHISITLSGEATYTLDELRELLYSSFVDPDHISSQEENLDNPEPPVL